MCCSSRLCALGTKKHLASKVPEVLVKGFEPPRFPRLILSQMRMPFRHTSVEKIIPQRLEKCKRGDIFSFLCRRFEK